MKELIRQTVLEYLAQRAAAAYQAEQIARMINLRKLFDEQLSEASVEEALAFLVSAGFASMTHGQMGASKHYQVTAAGTLAYERGA
jgi:DNA-binding PadR family transcriptional regulator